MENGLLRAHRGTRKDWDESRGVQEPRLLQVNSFLLDPDS